jgi:hypothetical protein
MNACFVEKARALLLAPLSIRPVAESVTCNALALGASYWPSCARAMWSGVREIAITPV